MDEQRDADVRRPTALTPMTEEECLALLGSSEVGRIAWCTPRGPVVLPVNIRLQGRTVLVRTAGSSQMVERIDAERVAIQVDHLDIERHEGWSVLAHGLAEVRPGAAGAQDPEPWPTGERTTEVRIALDEVSGRRLAPPGSRGG